MTHFIDGNQITLLRNGTEYFPALVAAIADAKREIHLQTYIYADDETGILIGNALKQAAQRGVIVNILLDGFGCKDLAESYIEALKLAGVRVIIYRPKISPWSLKKRRLRRLHHKIVTLDGKIAFVGGINIIDDYDVPNQSPPRVDYAVRIEGKLVTPIVTGINKLWRRIAWIHLKPSPSSPITHATATGNIKAAFVVRDNLLHRRDIEEAYLTAIAQARTEIIIANAYFVPGRVFRNALIAAAKRGVSVKLLLQGRKEYFLMFATHVFYDPFLKGGIKIYEYRKSFMHSKVAVIDKEWATVGSSNIDPFSLLLGREANVIVQDTDFASDLRADILFSIQEGAHRVLASEWANGNRFKRFASWIAYGLVRAFLDIIGHANEQ